MKSHQGFPRPKIYLGEVNPTIFTKGGFLNSQGRIFSWSRGKISEYVKHEELALVSEKNLLALDLEFNVERPPQEPTKTWQELLEDDSDTDDDDDFEVDQIMFNVVGVQIIQNVFVVCYLVNNFRMESCTIKLAFIPRNAEPGNKSFC